MNKSAAALLCASLSLWPLTGWTQEDREAVRKTCEAVRKSFIGLDISLKKKSRIEKTEIEEDSSDAVARKILQLAENEQTLETWGVAITKDLILMPDLSLKESDVAKIEAVDASGAMFEATFHAIGRNHDFVLLKPVAPRELVPLAFSDWERPALGGSFHVTIADRVDGVWHLNVSPYIQTNSPLVEIPGWFCMDTIRPGSLISDGTGLPVGIALDQYLWVRPDGRSSFLGKAILADERLVDIEKRIDPMRQELAASVKRVEITFRAEKTQERYVPPDDAQSGRVTLFGVPLDDQGTLFIPETLSRDMVRKIEDIRVMDEGKAYVTAFTGLFRAFGGMIVRAEGLKTRSLLARDGQPPTPGAIFLTATFEDRFGRSRIKVDYNRLFRTERGLSGAPRLQPRKRIKSGSLLLDFEGRVIGFATIDKKEEDFDEVVAEASREWYATRHRTGTTSDHFRRLIFFSEIAEILAAPASHFDARAIPMSKKEDKKLVWLGVEFQDLSKPLAQALAIQDRDLTNDGRRGLLITEIYADSPAKRAGLKPEDILLAIQPEGEKARDLVAEPERSPFSRSGMGSDRGGVPWKPTRNHLTSLLTEIGPAKRVTFDLLRGREKSKSTLELEFAPVDFETAERHKDDALGLTVRDLTYEVRHFQKLDSGTQGVVVAKVESGGKSDIAKLPLLSIISRVNDLPVRDSAHFKKLASASKSLTLTTVSNGRTKLVELLRE